MTKPLSMTSYDDVYGRRVVKIFNHLGIKWYIESEDGYTAEECPSFMVRLFESSQRIKVLTKVSYWESKRISFTNK